jgi:hypothetical protein
VLLRLCAQPLRERRRGDTGRAGCLSWALTVPSSHSRQLERIHRRLGITAAMLLLLLLLLLLMMMMMVMMMMIAAAMAHRRQPSARHQVP